MSQKIKYRGQHWLPLSTGALVLGLLWYTPHATAASGKTYTPAQLRAMVKAGKYPDQGKLDREETVQMTWDGCLAKMQSVLETVRPNYPVKTIVSTQTMASSKVWANDAAMTVTCYSDGRMHITSALYK